MIRGPILVIENPPFISEIAEIFGRQSVVVSLDVKKNNGTYIIVTNSGNKEHNLDLIDTVKLMETSGAGEIIINSIDNDGTQEGFDIELIRMVSQEVNIPVIAIGGAGSYDDLTEAVIDGTASAVAAGSLFVFIGRKRAVLINYPDDEELEEMFTDLT